jgi:hypothetical protein
MRRSGHPIKSLFGAGKGSLGKTLGSADTLLGNYYGLAHTIGQLGKLFTPNTSDYFGDRSTVSELYGPRIALIRDHRGNPEAQGVSIESDGGVNEIADTPEYTIYSKLSPKNRGLYRAMGRLDRNSPHWKELTKSYVNHQNAVAEAQKSGLDTYAMKGHQDLEKIDPNDLKFLGVPKEQQ